MTIPEMKAELERLQQESEDDPFIPCIGILGPHTHQYYFGAPTDAAEKCEAAQMERSERILNRNNRIRELEMLLIQAQSQPCS